jgi:predicted permease
MNLWLDAFVPAFALLGLGALLRRVLLPLDAVWAGMEKLIYWVLLPSLILSALAALDPASLPLGAMAFTIWGALATGTLISVLLARFMGHGHAAMTSILQGGIRFNNLMGFAIVGAIFGAEGISFGAVATGIIVPFVQSVTTLAFAMDGTANLAGMVYNFKHHDIYDWIKNNKNYFDLSESLRPDLKDNTNIKALGKFKDENNSLLITEFLALNPKVYSFKCVSLNEKYKDLHKDDI